MFEPTQIMKHTPFARNIWARSRLLSCLLFACLLFVLEPKAFRLSTRLLVSWNLGTWLYIVIALVTMARATEHSIKRRAAAGDESRFIVLTFACLASVTSLVAILAELGIAKDAAGFSKTFHLFLAGITIVSAWTFIHLIFTQHYAHEYFIERDHDDDPTTPPESLGGLHFPGTQLPDFSDFLYFSYVIGVACQTADVETTSRPMRRVVLIHCILSFFFNTTILALTINLAAGLV
ncbi:MAG TPA: DUF1345 domain-containing protein [Beijerinckiaceae bacterium]|jgi:uncharacterized membrane protein|nr:DUF1345 domain-containing protein [Beijerinckiaceae bacterium]